MNTLSEKLRSDKLTFGRLLHSIRLSEEMSQVQFAKFLAISKQVLCDIEKGRRFISPKLAASYAEKLGCSSKIFIQLCLQDILDRDGIDFVIHLEAVIESCSCI